MEEVEADSEVEKERKDKLQADWWEVWWEQDFTWDGLASKPLNGWVVVNGMLREVGSGRVYGQCVQDNQIPVKGRDATLQDYWRADPVTGWLRSNHEMISEWVSTSSQPLFHRVHLPLSYQDGTLTEKALWSDNALDILTSLRLVAAMTMECEDERLERELFGPDVRAQFQGGVWRCAAAHSHFMKRSLSVRYDFAAFCSDATFKHAIFSGEAIFDNASFSGEACFEQTTFLGDAHFEGATFLGDAIFERARFSGEAIFHHAVFSGSADFQSTTFSRLAFFDSATFFENVGFDSATMADEANFDSAIFAKQFAFSDATFCRNAFFVGTQITSGESSWRRAFSGCLFERLTDWSHVDRLPVAAFAGARLDRGILLSRSSEGEDQKAHRGALAEALALGDSNEQQAALKALEGGALQIKLALEQASDRLCEQRFYRLELRARRKQSGTPWTEKFFSWIYAAVSNYGASMGWPFIWLLGLILIFALFYWGAATGFRIDPGASVAWSALIEASSVSLSRIFPFGAFEEVTKEWILAREKQYGPVAALGLRMVASIQSAFAILLLFLFGLAIRRRFQIS